MKCRQSLRWRCAWWRHRCGFAFAPCGFTRLPLCLAPRSARQACGFLSCSGGKPPLHRLCPGASRTPWSHPPARPRARRCAPVARRRVRPVRPPGGSLLPGACCAAGPRAGMRRSRARLARASQRKPEQPARRCAPCPCGWLPASGRSTPSLLQGEGATAAPGPQGRCAPPHGGGLRPALTAWLRCRPMRS